MVDAKRRYSEIEKLTLALVVSYKKAKSILSNAYNYCVH